MSCGLRARSITLAATLTAALAVLLGTAPHALAIWAGRRDPVPVERLITNLQRRLKSHPKDAEAHYALGRVHSLAYATGSDTVHVSRANGEGKVEFPPFESVQVRRDPEKTPTEKQRRHLLTSVRHYAQAVRLSPKTALYALGLGWMLEQGAGQTPGTPVPDAARRMLSRRAPGVSSTQTSRSGKRLWEDCALSVYRRAYDLAAAKDRKERKQGPEADSAVSYEAAQGMLRILEGRRGIARDERAIAAVKRDLESVRPTATAVTPIIFGSRPGSETLSALLDPGRVVSFDLAGDGAGARWPWPRPGTNLLVWDPEDSGRITSGRQLFGSATWWLFFADGYKALAALDDDGDGWLSGPELRGIGVWRDADGDAASDPGEVRPARRAGVRRIAVRAAGLRDGVLWNPRGIELDGGAALPTFDWVAEPVR